MPPSSRRPAPWIRTRFVVVAMVLVVASFTATVVFSQLELRPIGDHADDILTNATPSVVQLSAVETELVLLGMRLNEYVDHAGNDVQHLREDLAAARTRVDGAFESYRELPQYPGEAEYVDRVVADFALLDEAREEVLRTSDLGSPQDANHTLKVMFDPRLERTLSDLADLRAYNASFISKRSAAIVAARRSALEVVAVLGGTSILVAIVATVLVVRMLRSRARVVYEHGELLAARASELEIFAGRVAHDLRNPLSSIGLRLAAAQQLDHEKLSPQMRENLSKASHQVQRMAGLIDGMLEFARAGANPGGSADLGAVLDDVIAEVRPVADVAHAELRVESFPPTKLACEPPALASVLSNLLGNAVKYGGKSDAPPQIHVRVDTRPGTTHVEVEDNGRGLPPGTEQLVFEPFRQLSKGQPGIGLGLATVKKIVEAHGGRVGVRSSPGGSTFWFELPQAA